jgi:AP-1 complex subunit gamma-1
VASAVATVTNETTSVIVKQYGLTALVKIATTCPVTSVLALAVFEVMMGSMDCELQQRACEYSMLITDFTDLAKVSFARMPPLIAEDCDIDAPSDVPTSSSAPDAHHTAAAAAPPTADFMDDLFSKGEAPPAAAQPAAAKQADPFGDLFGGAAPSPPATAPAPRQVGEEVFAASDVAVRLSMTRGAAAQSVSFFINNKTTSPLSNVSVLVAVPKTVTLDIKPLTVTTIAPSAVLEQAMSVELKGAPKLMLKVKLVFHANGQEVTHVFQVSKDVPLF